MNGREEYMVCVRCTTYNHEAFIKDAMKGFVMQETSFPYVCVIVDDASTDSTPEIIKHYLSEDFDVEDSAIAYQEETNTAHILFARHSKNRNCFFEVIFLKENHFRKKQSKAPYFEKWINDSRYVAFCEGDDFWTDPCKLQMQVDFLESHSDYSMCFHQVSVICEEKEKWIFANTREGDYTARQIYDDWIIPTCSVLYRTSANPVYNNRLVLFSDIYIWLQLAEKGKLHCLGFNGGTYRRHNGGFSYGYSVDTSVRLYHQYVYFEKRFPELKDISRRKQETQGLKAIIYAPYFPGIWKYRFLYMFRHPELFLTSFFTNTILSYTPLRFYKRWKGKKS